MRPICAADFPGFEAADAKYKELAADAVKDGFIREKSL